MGRVLAATPYLQFVLTDVVVEMRDGTAVLTCTENLLSAAEACPNRLRWRACSRDECVQA